MGGTAGYMHGTAGYKVEKVKIVSVHVRYFSFFSFFSLCLTGYAGYIMLRQFTSEGRDMELDNKTETSQ